MEGSTEALTNLGVFYLKGIHGEENYNMGLSLTKHVADLGNIHAKSNMAYLYKMSHEYKNAYFLPRRSQSRSCIQLSTFACNCLSWTFNRCAISTLFQKLGIAKAPS